MKNIGAAKVLLWLEAEHWSFSDQTFVAFSILFLHFSRDTSWFKSINKRAPNIPTETYFVHLEGAPFLVAFSYPADETLAAALDSIWTENLPRASQSCFSHARNQLLPCLCWLLDAGYQFLHGCQWWMEQAAAGTARHTLAAAWNSDFRKILTCTNPLTVRSAPSRLCGTLLRATVNLSSRNSLLMCSYQFRAHWLTQQHRWKATGPI